MENPVARYLEKHPDDKAWKLAKRAGLAGMTVYKILHGRSAYIRPETMTRLVEGSNGKIKLADLQAYNMAMAGQ